MDATAAHRMMWFDKNNPNVVYMDMRDDEQLAKDYYDCQLQRQRKTITWYPLEPTTKGDFRDLSQFQNETFKLILFDPPHLQWLGQTSIFKKKFGQLNKETWPMDIKLAAAEMWRVLAPWGVLIFKWNDHDIDYRKVIKLFPERPLFGQISAGSKGKTGKGRSHTFWFTFMKIPKTVSQKQSEETT